MSKLTPIVMPMVTFYSITQQEASKCVLLVLPLLLVKSQLFSRFSLLLSLLVSLYLFVGLALCPLCLQLAHGSLTPRGGFLGLINSLLLLLHLLLAFLEGICELGVPRLRGL